ncbi:hypothetical protein KK141_08490 [Dyella sp. LX-66]|uniref:hypothetical protein n=1 Tax=unclassified Dyella TaxID=2634549 RepID=UPI001BE0A486|nr:MULTISPECIES: hypothetical protein [unclassified Dyella]MBT2115754.1 hypothetical protein [Dyella sp. LX-1]MBT2139569.1 hypothetical protein [Dyella sp. LX-66]
MDPLPPLGPAPLPPPPVPTPPRKRVPLWLILLGSLIVAIVAAVGGLAWWGWLAFEKQAVVAMAADPVIAEHIGNIRSSEFDWTLTSSEPDEDTFAFHLKGERGSGTVVARFITEDADSETIDGGVLIMQDGSRIPLRSSGTQDDSEDDERG